MAQMRIQNLIISSFFCLIASTVIAQNDFYLRSKSDTSVLKKIKAVNSVSVPFADTIDQIRMFVNLEKQLFSDDILLEDTIEFWVWKQIVNGFMDERSFREDEMPDQLMTTKFRGDGYGYYANLSIDNLTSIQTKNRLLPIANAGIYISLFSTIVISPLVSYSFRNKAVNSSRYKKLTGIGLLSTASFISLRIPLKHKNYRLDYPDSEPYGWEIIRKQRHANK
jgi:hypothetical protein